MAVVTKHTSWGRTRSAAHRVYELGSRRDSLPSAAAADLLLPYGNGRSYGDSCLNDGGAVILTRTLGKYLSFDAANGRLRCESGVLLAEILDLVVPQGWFLPVTPGTQFVTVGGAIANDVHGKNHHYAGTFGCHVIQLELLRSDTQRLLCSPTQNRELFAATVGGLGLTGLVTWAELQLRRIRNPWIDQEIVRFTSLDEFFALSQASDRDYEYTVSWIDCLSEGRQLGRGLFTRGNHAPSSTRPAISAPRKLNVPFTPPVSMINVLTLQLFNTLYYHKGRSRRDTVHYEPFFYPLDKILNWNRIYGPKGFYQYQCVLPTAAGPAGIARLLREISRRRLGSFLAVLKACGDIVSPGMLSFPMPGVTLALDFPGSSRDLEGLFSALDQIVTDSGGRLYAAKDARMPGSLFRQGYPNWEEFQRYIDPRFSSSFWRRVMENT